VLGLLEQGFMHLYFSLHARPPKPVRLLCDPLPQPSATWLAAFPSHWCDIYAPVGW